MQFLPEDRLSWSQDLGGIPHRLQCNSRISVFDSDTPWQANGPFKQYIFYCWENGRITLIPPPLVIFMLFSLAPRLSVELQSRSVRRPHSGDPFSRSKKELGYGKKYSDWWAKKKCQDNFHKPTRKPEAAVTILGHYTGLDKELRQGRRTNKTEVTMSYLP